MYRLDLKRIKEPSAFRSGGPSKMNILGAQHECLPRRNSLVSPNSERETERASSSRNITPVNLTPGSVNAALNDGLNDER